MRSSVMLEWQFVNGDEWDALHMPAATAETQSTVGTTATPARIHHGWLLGAIGIVLLSVWTGALWFWPRITAGSMHPQAEVQKLPRTGSWPNQRTSTKTSDTPFPSNTLDQLRRKAASAPFTANSTVHSVELVGDLALVTVVSSQTDGAGAPALYRRIHLYRQGATGWEETAPTANLWGEQRILVTPYLRFEYHLRDAPAVEQAAHELDAIYAALRHDVGLAPAGQLTIRVIPRLLATGWHIEDQQLLASSPLLVRLPSTLSSTEALVQLLIDPFVWLAIHDLVQQHAIPLQWQEVVAGAQSWLRTTYCAARRVERAICHQAVLQQHVHAALSLAGLSLAKADSFAQLGYREYSFDSVALIDYIVAEHGRERLPAFLAALEEQTTWNTLIPEVFRVTASEFESRWQDYLYEKTATVPLK